MDNYWITRTGEKIKMSEMTDSHLKNAINYFRTKAPTKDQSERWKKLIAEAQRRGWKIDKNGKVTKQKLIKDRFDLLDI